jgi:hypothetical protein
MEGGYTFDTADISRSGLQRGVTHSEENLSPPLRLPRSWVFYSSSCKSSAGVDITVCGSAAA